MTFTIIKKGNNNFWHLFNNGAKEINLSDFQAVLDSVAQTFIIQALNGANIPQTAVGILDIIVIDETDASLEETFANVEALRTRLVELGYTPYLGAVADNITGLIEAGTNVTITGDGTTGSPYVISSSGGGGGAVASVNSDTGDVIVDLQSAVDEGNVVEYGAETTFAKFQTSADVFAQVASDEDGFVNFEVQQAVGEKTSYQTGAIKYTTGGVDYNLTYPAIQGQLGIGWVTMISNFTAVLNTPYSTNGTITVTDPTPSTNSGYIVHVLGGTSTIGGVGYTTGALVYRFYDGSSWISKNYNQDLQSVTDNGSNIDGNDIVVKNGLIEVINNAEDKFADFTFDGFAITDDVTADVSAYKLGEISNNSIVYPLPTGATSQIATLLDISNDAVLKSDYTPAHSILVQQSGTGTPNALSVGNNTLVGRLSGGGSDINDLSVSDVRTLLSIDTDLALRKRVYYENASPSTAVTGTTSETQISGSAFTIPANTIPANSHLFVLPTIFKTVGTNTTQLRLKVNTTNNYATATTIANFSISASNTFGGGHRKFIVNGGNIKGFSFATGVTSDLIGSGSGTSSTAFPVTGDLYFFWSIQNNAIGDSAKLESVQITS